MLTENSPASPLTAIAQRGRSTVLRLAIMAVFAVMLHRANFAYAAQWWCLYAAAQGLLLHAQRIAPRAAPGYGYFACFVSFAIAGAPSAHLWTLGAFGAAAASMWLCGMMVQLMASSLGSSRLFWTSAAPLAGYLAILPMVHFARSDPELAVTLAACAVLFTAYLGVAHRDQARAIAALEESRGEALAASRAKSEFLSVMSHEIRTPMNAVMGAADLLSRTRLTSEQSGHVKMLQDSGDVLMQVLNDVLDLGKIEAGKLHIEPADIDLHSFMDRCANFWRPLAVDAGLELTVEIDPATPRYARFDALRAGQIAFNLLSNALKFTTAGRIALSLSSADLEDGRFEVVLTVSDTGMGMDEDTLGRLFRPFAQADNSISRRFGGAGLGLVISRRVAEMMGGRIEVASEPGKGSRFSVRLPAEHAQAPVAPRKQAKKTAPAPIRARRILVAEDNPANQRIVELFLQPLGASVTVVANGQAAVEAASHERFDVILMDLQMPLLDGLEATRRIRASGGPNAAVPILALTANVMDSHRTACAEAGMTGHIPKPIDARALLTAVLSASADLDAGDGVAAA